MALRRVGLTNDVNDLPPLWDPKICEADDKGNERVFFNSSLAHLSREEIVWALIDTDRLLSILWQSESSSRKEIVLDSQRFIQ